MKIQLDENVLCRGECHGVGDIVEVDAKAGQDLIDRGLGHAVNVQNDGDDLDKILEGAVSSSTRKRRKA